MGRTKKFMYNVIATAGLQILTMVAGFVTSKIMLDTYGSEINGLISSINQFIAYFNLVEAGLSSAAVYALYKPIADKDHKAINGVVAAAKNLYMQSGYVFLFLTMGLAIIYPSYIKSSEVGNLGVGLLVLVLGVSGALEFFTLAKYRVVLTADQKLYITSIASMAHIILNTIIIIVLAAFDTNIVILRFVALLSVFLRSMILLVYCKKKYKFLDYKETPNVKALNKRWDALYLQILRVAHTGAPVVIITLILKDLNIVSIYAVFNMVISGISGVLSIFMGGLSASFGEVIAKKETKALQRAYKEFEFSYYFLVTTMYAITLITIMPFIQIYTANVQDVNYNLPITGFLFVLNGMLYNIQIPQDMLVSSAGLYKETKRQTITQGLIAIILGSALAPFLGINGVLLGSIMSNLYRDIDLIYFIPKNVTKTKKIDTFYRMVRILFCVMVCFVLSLFVTYEPTTFLTWVFYAAGAGIFVVIVVLGINYCLDKQEIINVSRRIKGLIVRKNKILS